METLLTTDFFQKNKHSNFYYSFLLLPKPKREAINVVYAWCRYTDDIVDDENVNNKSMLLRQWGNEFEQAIQGTSQYPLLNKLSQTIQRFNIPLHHFRDLLKGMEMDITKTRYTTFTELEQYCYYAASTVGLICTEIFGYKNEESKQYAHNLGIALQLTNILRDVAVDAKKGRIYLPQEDLQKFGYTEEDLYNNNYNSSFYNLMKYEAERAHHYFSLARTFLFEEDKPLFIAAQIMEAMYQRILSEIEQVEYNIFSHRIKLSSLTKLSLATQVWWNNKKVRTSHA